MKGYLHNVRGDEKAVTICNDSDDFYWCEFETPQEVNEFIKRLEEARDKAFNEDKK